VRGPRFESRCGQFFYRISTAAAVCNLWHRLHILTLVPWSMKPSAHLGTIEWVLAFKLSNNNKWWWWIWMVAVFTGELAIQVGWLAVRFVGHLVLSRHSAWGQSTPSHPFPPLSIHFIFYSFLLSPFPFLIRFIYFLLSIPSLCTRIVPLRFQAEGRRRRPFSLFVSILCYLYFLRMHAFCCIWFSLVLRCNSCLPLL